MGPIRMKAGSRKRRTAAQELIDQAFDCYRLWRDECAEVRRTYVRWASSPRAARTIMRDDYLLALEREEHAALRYEQVLGRLVA